MIIDIPYKEGDTVTLKTTGGEEVIGRYVKDDTTTITLKKPMSIVMGQQGVGLGPFAVTLNPDVQVAINKHATLFVHKTDGEMAKQYIASTSGIQLV